jgi:hypothetical protein
MVLGTGFLSCGFTKSSSDPGPKNQKPSLKEETKEAVVEASEDVKR